MPVSPVAINSNKMKKIYLVLFVFLCGLGSNAQTHENKLHQPTRHHTRTYHPGKNHTKDRLHSHRPRTYHAATHHRRKIYRLNHRPQYWALLFENSYANYNA